MQAQTLVATDRPSGWTSYPASKEELPKGLLDDLAIMIGRRLSAYADARLSYLAQENDMPQADFRALAFIVEFESVPTGQLAQLMGLSPGGITALINRLETGGFIRRDRDKADRRVVALKPVPERCAGMAFSEEGIIRHIVSAAGYRSVLELKGIHEFLACCLDGQRQETLKWLALSESGDDSQS